MKCTLCNGKGNDGYHRDEECPLCDGTGEIEASAIKPKKQSKKYDD